MIGFGAVHEVDADLARAAKARMATTLPPRCEEFGFGNVRMVASRLPATGLAVDESADRLLIRIGDVWENSAGGLRATPTRVPTPAEMYKCWQLEGEQGIHRYDGCWSLVACDPANQSALIIVDRFNSHPVYWALDGRRHWVIGSTVQTVARGRGTAIRWDEVAVIQFLHFQRVFGDRSIVSGIRMTKPGSWLQIGPTSVRSGNWFRYDYAPEAGSPRQWAESLAATFRSATRNVQNSDTNLLLSGGLDSRLVLACTTQPIRCVHFNDHINREAVTSKALAAAHGSELRVRLRPDDHYIKMLPRAAAIGSGSFVFYHAHTLGLGGIPPHATVIHGFAPELYFRGTNLPFRYLRGLGSYSPFASRVKRSNVIDMIITRLKYNLSAVDPSRILVSEARNHYRSTLNDVISEIVAEAQTHSEDPFDWFTWPDTFYQSRYPSYLFENAIRAEYRERSVTMQNGVLDLHLKMPRAVRGNNRIWIRALELLAPSLLAVPDANHGHRPTIRPSLLILSRVVNRGRRLVSSRQPGNSFGCAWFTDGSWPDLTRMLVGSAEFREAISAAALTEGHLPEIIDAGRLRTVIDQAATAPNHKLSDLVFVAATLGSWGSQFAAAAPTGFLGVDVADRV
ncbi:MAG: hypothetical protein FGM52_04305 [Mycobacterium sp.]|nr:hypothetical protein [Mycobacterium sp.]